MSRHFADWDIYLPFALGIFDTKDMLEACCYEDLKDKRVKCNLCILKCMIRDGKRGFCRVRENKGGRLYNIIYGKLSSLSTDYIEKAPLYHFYPNHKFLTLGSLGCNLKCDFCLTWNITQVEPSEVKVDEMPAEKIVRSAKELTCKGIVYTHSEPTMNLEYYAEIMREAKKHGLVNVFATNGLISLEALDMLLDSVDAIPLTVKGSGDFYSRVCGARVEISHFERLVDAINDGGIHLEMVYVLISGFNDDEESLHQVIGLADRGNAPLIFLRFFPSYRMDHLDSPPEEEMERALNMAYGHGLKYAYLENIYSHPGKNTYCENCKKSLIKREGYGVVEWNLNGDRCSFCGVEIPVVGEPYI
jgi:pyruvate formate lyase activating enzyme